MLPGNDQVGCAVDPVKDGLACSIAVVEEVLAVCIVDVEHGEFQLPVPFHGFQPDDPGGGFFPAAPDILFDFGIFVVHHVQNIPAVVNNDVRFGLDDQFDTFIVQFCIRTMEGIDIQSAVSQCSRDIILCGKRIGAGDVHFSSACRQDTAQIGGFGLKMDGQGDPDSLERLIGFKLFLNAAEQRHIAAYPFNLVVSGRSETDVTNVTHKKILQ